MKNDEHTLLLGEIKGKLDALDARAGDQADVLRGIETRLGKLEVKSATHGALFGALSAIGVTMIVEKIKHMTGMGS